MKPKRIQRKRAKGWRMPQGAIYVGRPTKWGNLFKVGQIVSHLLTDHDWASGGYSGMGDYDSLKDRVIDITLSLQLFAIRSFYNPVWRFSIKKELRGHDLVCWCDLCEKHEHGKPIDVYCADCDPCHADILLELANQ